MELARGLVSLRTGSGGPHQFVHKISSTSAWTSRVTSSLPPRFQCSRLRPYCVKIPAIRSFASKLKKDQEYTYYASQLDEFWDGRENVARFLDAFARSRDINYHESWYKVRLDDIKAFGGGRLIQSLGSLDAALNFAYPTKEPWLPWLFDQVPLGFWNSAINQRKYLEWLGKKLGFHESDLASWYKAKQSDFLENRGHSVLKKYESSYTKVIMSLFPEYDWLPWLFHTIPHGFWDDPRNAKRFLDWLRSKYNFNSFESVYSLTASMIAENGGKQLLVKHRGIFGLVKFVYSSEGEWLPWLFERSPDGIWDDRETVLSYLKWLSNNLNYRRPEDWYECSSSIIRDNHGEGLLEKYGGLAGLLNFAFTDSQYIPWKFSVTPEGFWSVLENRKQYIKWLKDTVGVTDDNDLLGRHFLENHGAGLLNNYRNSVSKVLESLEVKVKTTSVSKHPLNHFKNLENQRQFAIDIARQKGFDPSDEQSWYKLTLKDFSSPGGEWFLQKYYHSSIYAFLRAVYPTVDWKPWKFKKSQIIPEDDHESMKKVCQYIEETFALKTREDWARVSSRQLAHMKVKSFVEKAGGIHAFADKYSSY